MFALMFALLWVGVLCLCYRQLHQTSALSVGMMEGSYRDTLDCTEEDITDKVRAVLPALSWSTERLATLRDLQAGVGLKLQGLPAKLQRSCVESGGGTGAFSRGRRCACPACAEGGFPPAPPGGGGGCFQAVFSLLLHVRRCSQFLLF